VIHPDKAAYTRISASITASNNGSRAIGVENTAIVYSNESANTVLPDYVDLSKPTL